MLAALIAVEAVVIWNSGAERPAAARVPGGTKSGRKKLKTVGERSAAWPRVWSGVKMGNRPSWAAWR